MSYCEFPEFFVESEPIARKEYDCVECSARILKGEKHYKYSGKWDGRFDAGRQHFLCRDACVFIRDTFQWGECIGFGALYEFYREFSEAPVKKRSLEVKQFRNIMAKILLRERNE